MTAETKLAVLREVRSLSIDAGQAVALGDGNDIEMIRAAGLGVAYRGKPVTRCGRPVS